MGERHRTHFGEVAGGTSESQQVTGQQPEAS